MYPSAGGCRGGAKVHIVKRGGIGIDLHSWAREELPGVLHSAVDVSADVVGVVLFKLRGSECVARQDEVAKAGGETFDLGLDALAHIEGRASGDVTIGPGGVFSLWRARRVEQALLGEQYERLFGVLAPPDRGFGGGNFWQRAAHMDGRGTLTCWRSPGDGAVQRQVKLEDAGAIAVMAQFALVAGWQARTCYAQQLPADDGST